MNYLPLLTTLLAGLATALGALVVKNEKNEKLQGVSLSFATGVMLVIAVGELLPESVESLGIVKTILFSVCGALISVLLDVLFPHHHDHEEHEKHRDHEHTKEFAGHYLEDCECAHHLSVSKSMICALILHNVIEGLATGLTVVSDIRLGIAMAFGIALHNIPIGTTLAISWMSAKKTKKSAVLMATLVGLSQCAGACIGMLVADSPYSEAVLNISMAMVSGILIFISFDELWPASRQCSSRIVRIVSMICGICLIPLSELFI